MTPAWASLAAAFEARVVLWVDGQKGAPYLWTGKGGMAWDATKGLRPWRQDELDKSKVGYDCSGLITCALREVTAVDLRSAWKAQTIYSATRQYEGQQVLRRTLRFYGSGRGGVIHVSIGDEVRGPHVMPVLVLEAAGAGSDATSERIARSLSACVRHVVDHRQDLVASVPLWALAVAAGALVAPPAAK